MDRPNHTLRLLVEAGQLLDGASDPEEALTDVGRLAVRRLADWYRLDLLQADGSLRLAAAAHRSPHYASSSEPMSRHFWPRPGSGVQQALAAGQPLAAAEPTDELLNEQLGSPSRLQDLGLSSCLWVPLAGRDGVFGVLTLGSTVPGGLTEQATIDVAAELGRRIALTVDNARLHRETGRAALLREDMLAMVSHDLRSPLGTIDMTVSLLLRQTETPRSKGLLRNIQRACRRTARLLDTLLDLGRIGAGRLQVQREAVPAKALLADALQRLSAVASGRAVALSDSVDVPDALTVNCDRARFLLALENLLGHAVENSAAGYEVLLRAQADNDWLNIEIVARGAPLAAGTMARLLDPYAPDGPPRRRGTGVELFVAKGIVDAHGGSLEAGDHGGGTTFRLRIPRR